MWHANKGLVFRLWRCYTQRNVCRSQANWTLQPASHWPKIWIWRRETNGLVVESMLIFPGTLVKIIIFFCQMNHLNLNLSQVQSIWTGTFSRSESCSDPSKGFCEARYSSFEASLITAYERRILAGTVCVIHVYLHSSVSCPNIFTFAVLRVEETHVGFGSTYNASAWLS